MPRPEPPAYVVAEIEVTNLTPYDKEYVPAAMKAIAEGGGKYTVRGGKLRPCTVSHPKGALPSWPSRTWKRQRLR